jgi:hypothetical protein
MNYVVAGYVIAMSVLFAYAVSLLIRRARLERAAALVDTANPPAEPVAAPAAPTDGPS